MWCKSWCIYRWLDKNTSENSCWSISWCKKGKKDLGFNCLHRLPINLHRLTPFYKLRNTDQACYCCRSEWAWSKQTRQLSNQQKNYIIGAFNHFFLPNSRNCAQWTRKELWLCANGRSRMHSRLTRNCGYGRFRMCRGSPCAFFSHWFSTAIWIICNLVKVRIETKGLISKQTTLHVLHTFAVGQHLSTENWRHSLWINYCWCQGRMKAKFETSVHLGWFSENRTRSRPAK